MNRKQRRRAQKDLSLRLNKLKGYARRGSARAAALLVLAKKEWVDGGLSREDIEKFQQEHEQAHQHEPEPDFQGPEGAGEVPSPGAPAGA